MLSRLPETTRDCKVARQGIIVFRGKLWEVVLDPENSSCFCKASALPGWARKTTYGRARGQACQLAGQIVAAGMAAEALAGPECSDLHVQKAGRLADRHNRRSSTQLEHFVPGLWPRHVVDVMPDLVFALVLCCVPLFADCEQHVRVTSFALLRKHLPEQQCPE